MVEQEETKQGRGGGKTEAVGAVAKTTPIEQVEGRLLLGRPTFTAMENGRFRCIETGHEMLAKDMEAYCGSKRCRLGLIDFALLHKKPPLNMFKQHPDIKSKIICKLTKDIINKSEEHIWKHITGRRFQNQLEIKEAENGSLQEGSEKVGQLSCKQSKSGTHDIKKIRMKAIDKDDSNASEAMNDNVGVEEPDFWMPPIGNCKNVDESNDRKELCNTLVNELEEDATLIEMDEAKCKTMESEALSVRTKRLAIEVGPSSFASRKKKSKKSHGQ